MTTINDSLIRAVALETGALAEHILECRQRLQALSNKVYSQLALADPVTDRDFEQFILRLCRAINALHDAAPVAHWSAIMRRFHLPPVPEPAPEPISPCAADPRAALAPIAPSAPPPACASPRPSAASIPSTNQEPAPCNA